MPSWPQTIPHDLKRMLEIRAGFRDPPTEQDLWGVFLEWLQRHDVPAPKDLPSEAEQPTISLGHKTPPRPKT